MTIWATSASVIIVYLAFRCFFLARELGKAKRKTADLERLWLETWSKWEKDKEKLRKVQANRDMWQRQWTEGKFELDAAAMATLVDQEQA